MRGRYARYTRRDALFLSPFLSLPAALPSLTGLHYSRYVSGTLFHARSFSSVLDTIDARGYPERFTAACNKRQASIRAPLNTKADTAVRATPIDRRTMKKNIMPFIVISICSFSACAMRESACKMTGEREKRASRIYICMQDAGIISFRSTIIESIDRRYSRCSRH